MLGTSPALRRQRPALKAVGFALAAVLLVVAAWLVGIVDPPGLGSPAPWAASQIGAVPTARLDAARAAFASLAVEPRPSKAGYARERFGAAWEDVDRNGCDTRNDVLARDLRGLVFVKGTADCLVASGSLSDPYTGRLIAFARGERSAVVQIDHVVPLSDAWQKGAQRWTAGQRVAFANDPANLLAVDGGANQQKGDADLSVWLPPARSFRCEYTVRIVEIKAKYGLGMTDAERRKAGELLGQCRGG